MYVCANFDNSAIRVRTKNTTESDKNATEIPCEYFFMYICNIQHLKKKKF